ncbi:MAG: hypothetical protein HY698_00780 [Deltaproteobacteria bacterium]|nr:hypothetical protein [Deltaproteobacteria bacterium]
MSGTPDLFASIFETTHIIAELLPFDPLKMFKDALFDWLVQGATGMTVDEWKNLTSNPETYLRPDWKAELDRQMALKGDVMAIDRFAAAHNTVAYTKMSFLGGTTVFKMLRDLGYGGGDLYPDERNIILGYIKSLDGSRQWYENPQQMIVAKDCYLYSKLFMNQKGDGHDPRVHEMSPRDSGICPKVESVVVSAAAGSPSTPSGICASDVDINVNLRTTAGELGAIVDMTDYGNTFSDASLPRTLWVPAASWYRNHAAKVDDVGFGVGGVRIDVGGNRLNEKRGGLDSAGAYLESLVINGYEVSSSTDIKGYVVLGCSYGAGTVRVESAAFADGFVDIDATGRKAGEAIEFTARAIPCASGFYRIWARYPLETGAYPSREAWIALKLNPIKSVELARHIVSPRWYSGGMLLFGDPQAEVVIKGCEAATSATTVSLSYENATGPANAYLPAGGLSYFVMDGTCGETMSVSALAPGQTAGVRLTFDEPTCVAKHYPAAPTYEWESPASDDPTWWPWPVVTDPTSLNRSVDVKGTTASTQVERAPSVQLNTTTTTSSSSSSSSSSNNNRRRLVFSL